MAGLGLLDERVQLPGMGVRCDSLIPKRFAVFQQPISHRMNIPGFKLCDCGFNFLHSTHGRKVSDWCVHDKSANAARGKEGLSWHSRQAWAAGHRHPNMRCVKWPDVSAHRCRPLRDTGLAKRRRVAAIGRSAWSGLLDNESFYKIAWANGNITDQLTRFVPVSVNDGNPVITEHFHFWENVVFLDNIRADNPVKRLR